MVSALRILHRTLHARHSRRHASLLRRKRFRHFPHFFSVCGKDPVDERLTVFNLEFTVDRKQQRQPRRAWRIDALSEARKSAVWATHNSIAFCSL
jgi:hypothetical protein